MGIDLEELMNYIHPDTSILAVGKQLFPATAYETWWAQIGVPTNVEGEYRMFGGEGITRFDALIHACEKAVWELKHEDVQFRYNPAVIIDGR